MHRHRVKYACGDETFVYLVSRSAYGRRQTLQLLACSLCPACQRRSRYAAARRCAEDAGLLPLQAGCPEHLVLAEIIRISLWRGLAVNADARAAWLLAALFNRHTSAAFWLSLRGLSMAPGRGEEAEAIRIGALLIWLLQPVVGREGSRD